MPRISQEPRDASKSMRAQPSDCCKRSYLKVLFAEGPQMLYSMMTLQMLIPLTMKQSDIGSGQWCE